MEAREVRVHVVISGRVQGVFYRWSTKETADGLGLTGWVRNLPDGRVELLAEGEKERIDRLLDWCRQGPDMARVDDLAVETEGATGEYKEFSIRH